MTDCEFCHIIAGESPGSFVYEDEVSLALLALRPMNRGHTLIIPKTHAASLAELDEGVGGHLFEAAMNVAELLRESPIKCDGVNLWLADGPVAGQEVFHVHLHVLPRFEEDSIRLEADRIDPSRKEMNATAEQIRSAI